MTLYRILELLQSLGRAVLRVPAQTIDESGRSMLPGSWVAAATGLIAAAVYLALPTALYY